MIRTSWPDCTSFLVVAAGVDDVDENKVNEPPRVGEDVGGGGERQGAGDWIRQFEIPKLTLGQSRKISFRYPHPTANS